MPSRARGRRDILLALIGGCLAAALLVSGVPSLIAATTLLQGEAALDLLRAGERPTAAGVERILDSRATALRWAPSGRGHVEIGTVLAALAQAADGQGVSGEEVLERGIAELRRGLSQAPADAVGWQQLALAAAARGQADEAATALGMSFRSDPHTVRFGDARTTLGVVLWDHLDRDLRALLMRELRTAFRLEPREAVRTALRSRSLPILRAALAADAQDAQGLEIILDDYRAAGN
jgi:hypothetical protein